MTAENPDVLLHLVVPPDAADLLGEWLLERDDVPGFTSLPVSGHGSSEHSMTLAEQVAGRSRRVLFITHLPAPLVEVLLDALQADFAHSGIHYWVTPLLRVGRLASAG